MFSADSNVQPWFGPSWRGNPKSVPDGYNNPDPDLRSPHFRYDIFSNLIADRDKEIKKIVYNPLHLPGKYMDDFIYKNSKLDFFPHVEGCVKGVHGMRLCAPQ